MTREFRKKKKTPENKDMGECNLNDREFKIVALKKLNLIHENSERKFKELRNKIN